MPLQIDAAPDPRDNRWMRTVLKSAAFGIAILAMMLRAALPQGWMPSSQGAAPLMLCPGMTEMAAMPAMSHEAPPQKPDHRHDGAAQCIFAAAAHPASPASAPPALLAAQAVTHIDFLSAHETPERARAYRPNAARAPPAFV